MFFHPYLYLIIYSLMCLRLTNSWICLILIDKKYYLFHKITHNKSLVSTMSASTVLRVKRRLEDNPQDALVILSKRAKADAEDITPALFVFRGTVDNQETAHVSKIVPRNEVKVQCTSNVKDLVEKLRKEHKDASIQNRYLVVNCSRGLKNNSNHEDRDQFNLVDVQKSDDMDDGVQYAYDLYTAAKQDTDISILDSFASIETDLIFDSYRANGQDTSSGDEADDDDSNEENNWRNDYPDSEHSSIDEQDMIRAMEKVDIGDDLSSDEGEDKIYDDTSGIFDENVKLYGAAYAKYKAKVLSENPDLDDGRNLIQCTRVKDLDEESIEGYKNDSDEGFYYGQDEDIEQFREQYHKSSDEYSPD